MSAPCSPVQTRSRRQRENQIFHLPVPTSTESFAEKIVTPPSAFQEKKGGMSSTVADKAEDTGSAHNTLKFKALSNNHAKHTEGFLESNIHVQFHSGSNAGKKHVRKNVCYIDVPPHPDPAIRKRIISSRSSSSVRSDSRVVCSQLTHKFPSTIS
ncbi:hypothetical protein AcW1_008152 [Taiwanofungus camphoratus]|nr:hypothetical protein AcW1_008152 [Antrodia cinnamomea]